MQASYRKLLGIPVRTRSGHALGKLSDLIIDTDTGRLAFVQVRTRGLIPGLMDHELRIAWAQVISLNEKEAVVTDGSVPAGATRFLASIMDRQVQAVPPSVQQKDT